jgi:hypothetical protein
VVDQPDHDQCVQRWMLRTCADKPPGTLVRSCSDAFNALYRRARQALGEVMVTAVVDRVLRVTVDRFPQLGDLQLGLDGLRCEVLVLRAVGLDRDKLASSLRCLMVELLTVLGALTAEVLTPALHAELSRQNAAGVRP